MRIANFEGILGLSVLSTVFVKAGLMHVMCSPSSAENRKSRWRVDFLSKEGGRHCMEVSFPLNRGVPSTEVKDTKII